MIGNRNIKINHTFGCCRLTTLYANIFSMDGIKIPLFLLVIVLALGVYLFNPLAKISPKAPEKNQSSSSTQIATKISDDLVKSSMSLFEKNEFAEVIKLLEPEINSDNFEILRMLAYSYAGVKNFDKAIVVFEKTLDMRKVPENGYSLAYLYEITGRINVARMLYNDLLSAELPPKMKRAAYEGLARTSSFENDTGLAFKHNVELVKKYPDSPEGVIALIKLMKHTGQMKNLDKLVAVGEVHHSKNFEYNFWLGALYFESGNFDEALKRFRRCIAITPDNSTPYYYTYKILKRQKNIEEALADLAKYHKFNPLLPHIFFEGAIDAKNEGKFDIAYKFIRSALTMNRTLLGRDDKGTMRAVERMVKAKGSELDKQFLTAFTNYINGDYKVARDQVIHLMPQIKAGELEGDARRIIRECDLLAAQDARYMAHEKDLQRQKEFEKMTRVSAIPSLPAPEQDSEVDKLKRQAMLNPKDLRLQYTTGLQLARLGYVDDARFFFDSAIRLNPNILEPNYSMAKILIFKENFSEARLYLDQALKINPNSSQTLSVSAALHLQNRDFSQAQGDAEAALKANPNNSEARLVLAEIFSKNNDFRRALQEIDLGLEIELDQERREKLLRLKESMRN